MMKIIKMLVFFQQLVSEHQNFSRPLVPCLLFVFTLCPGLSQAVPPQKLFDEAVGEYHAAMNSDDREERLARFRRAELLFGRLTLDGGSKASSPIHNADLYTNLGNAALGAEQLGAAILAFRQALMFDPDHHRARQNLKHARTLLPDWVPRPTENRLFDNFFGWSRMLSKVELRFIAALVFFAAAILFAAAIRWRQTTLRNLSMIPAVIWLILLGTIFVGARADTQSLAVVVVPEVIAKSADSAGAPPRLTQPLPSGTELEVIETRGDWVNIRLFDGRSAWISGSAIQRIGTTNP